MCFLTLALGSGFSRHWRTAFVVPFRSLRSLFGKRLPFEYSGHHLTEYYTSARLVAETTIGVKAATPEFIWARSADIDDIWLAITPAALCHNITQFFTFFSYLTMFVSYLRKPPRSVFVAQYGNSIRPGNTGTPVIRLDLCLNFPP